MLDSLGEIIQERLRTACALRQMSALELAKVTGLPLAEIDQCLNNPMQAPSRSLFQISNCLGIEDEIGEMLKPLI